MTCTMNCLPTFSALITLAIAMAMVSLPRNGRRARHRASSLASGHEDRFAGVRFLALPPSR